MPTCQEKRTQRIGGLPAFEAIFYFTPGFDHQLLPQRLVAEQPFHGVGKSLWIPWTNKHPRSAIFY